MSTPKDNETTATPPAQAQQAPTTEGQSELPSALPDFPPPTSTEPPPTSPG